MSTVFRIEKNRNFVVMNNEFLRNKEMSLKAKGLLALCLSLPETWDYSLSGLVAITKENLTAVRSGLKELQQHGHLKIEKTKNEKGQFIYNYIIFEVPAIDNVHVANQQVEKQCIENKTQISIEEESIKKESINKDLYILEQAPPELHSLLKNYLEMRKEIGAELTERGLKLLLSRLEKLSNNNINVQKIMLESATQNQWKNVYKPKDEEVEAYSKALVESLRSFYHL
jgi:hypothetical protein